LKTALPNKPLKTFRKSQTSFILLLGELMTDITLLKNGYLFDNLDPNELEKIAEITNTKEVITGDYIFDEGREADALYVIKTGSVEILKRGSSGGDEQSVTILSPGSHFGEMAFVDKAPRAAAAMAKENVKLLEIKYTDLERVTEANHEIGLKIYRSIANVLCKRIRQTTNNLSSLKELKLKSF
jgi:CRP-like cAMP-binding protein